MAPLEDLSDAQIILLAVELCCSARVDDLTLLAAQIPEVLSTELVLRILLTFLPASTEPSTYLPLIESLKVGSFHVDQEKQVDTSAVEELKDADAQERVGNLSLEHLKTSGPAGQGYQDDVTNFLFQRAYQIDTESRNLPAILQLVEPFIDESPLLRTWTVSTLLPLLRSEYEYYVDKPLSILLSDFESLGDRAAINTLLQNSRTERKDMKIGRDLRCLVGPWMYGKTHAKRRKLAHDEKPSRTPEIGSEEVEIAGSWNEVNDWILTRSKGDFDLAATAFLDWDGPSDVDLGGYATQDDMENDDESQRLAYVRVGLAIIYAAEAESEEVIDQSWRIYHRARHLSGFPAERDQRSAMPDITQPLSNIAGLSRASLLQNALLHSTNDLTRPNNEGLTFLQGILLSVKASSSLGVPMTCRNAAELCLFATKDVQKQELHKLLQGVAKSNRGGLDWLEIWDRVSWLRCWRSDREKDMKDSRALFWRVDLTFMQMEFLDALLTAARESCDKSNFCIPTDIYRIYPCN